MLSVDRLETIEALRSLEHEWTALLRRYAGQSLFLTNEFVTTWWEHFGEGKQLRVLVVRDGSEVVGIAPLMISRQSYCGLPVRMLGFLANRHTSRSDFIIPERGPEVMAALAAEMRRSAKDWDVLRLVHVPRESATLSLLAESLDAEGLKLFPVEPSRQLCRLAIQGTWEQHVRKQSKAFRDNIRNYRNRFKKTQGAAITRHGRPEEVAPCMARFFALENVSWKSNDDEVAFDDNDRRFYTVLAERMALQGGCDIRFVMVGDRDVGGFLSLVWGDVHYFLLNYFDASERHLCPERQLLAEVLEDRWSRPDLKWVDFNGDTAFIRSWAPEHQQFDVLSACHGRLYSSAISGLKRLKRLLVPSGGVSA